MDVKTSEAAKSHRHTDCSTTHFRTAGRTAIHVALWVLLATGPMAAGDSANIVPANHWLVTGGSQTAPPVALPQDAQPPRDAWVRLSVADSCSCLPRVPAPFPGLAFLWRVPQPPPDAVLTASVRAADKTISPGDQSAPTTRWQVVHIPKGTDLPEGEWYLELRAKTPQQVELLLPADPATPWSAEQALRDLAAYCAAQGLPGDERIAWESLAAIHPGTGKAAVALQRCADLLASSGDADAAANVYLQLLGELGPDVDTWATFPGGQGYSQDRAALDLAPNTRARLGQVARTATGATRSEAFRAAAFEYPARPSAKAAAVELAKMLIAVDAPSDALPWLALALDQGGDHDPTPAKLRLPENQVHLDAIARPTDPTVLSDAARLLLSASGDHLAEDALARVAAAWLAGEQGGLARDHDACAGGFQTAAEAAGSTVLNSCAQIAQSQWLQYLGYFIEAEDALPEADTISVDAVKQWRDFQLGCVLSAQGIYEDAYEAFVAATQGPSVVYSDVAWLRRGECLEFQGKWDEAVSAYAHLEAFASVPQFRAKARFWAHRVSNLAADYKPSIGVGAVYWGEDRQTQGQWDSYGEETFLLCGRMAPGDLMGGLAAPVRYRVYTADKSKHNWWWNYDPVTEHPSVMIDPPRAHATACNWDDGGEKQEVGTGPDLMVDFPIPEGLHRLSLYLVNDFNYYEPNREYTIYLLNADRHVLAACPVRDFEQGVYHHFAIQGPQTITFRVFRNLSMNTLLQGIFVDNLTETRPSSEQMAAWEPLIGNLPKAIRGHSLWGESLDPARARRGHVGAAAQTALNDPAQAWWAWREFQAFGAGAEYEKWALQGLADCLREERGTQKAAEVWDAVAEAQLAAGYRGRAVLLTRMAVSEATSPGNPRRDQCNMILRALKRMQGAYGRFYLTATDVHLDPANIYKKPVDEVYSRQLADRVIALASQDNTAEQLAALFAPVARDLFFLQRREVPRRLYAAVSMDHLSAQDIHRYADCLEDGPPRVEILRRAQAAGGPDAFPKGALIPAIIFTLVQAKDFAGADAELESYLSQQDVAPRTRASITVTACTMMMLHGQNERARRWLQRVLDDFPEETRSVESAKKLIGSGVKIPIGRGNK